MPRPKLIYQGDGLWEPPQADMAWFCSHDGYSPNNRGAWCALGCGSDYNRMIGVPARHVLPLVAVSEAARDLYERVQMDESVGVCLSSRVECLVLGEKLAALGGKT